MKKVLFYLLGTLVLILCSCSSGDSFLAQMGQTSLRHVWHSDCQFHTLTRNTIPEPTRLRLTYHEDTQSISGEYLDFRVNCAYTDAGMKIEVKDNGTIILNPWVESDNTADCICNVNIYFTIENITAQRFHLVLNQRTAVLMEGDGTTHEETWTDYDGFVSFKEKNTILITPSEE